MPYCGLVIYKLKLMFGIQSLNPHQVPIQRITSSEQSPGYAAMGTFKRKPQRIAAAANPELSADVSTWGKGKKPRRYLWWLLLVFSFGVQIPVALYFSLVHQRYLKRDRHLY